MFKNVLVGVDGNEGGRDAIALASRLADPASKLTLVHVHGGELVPSQTITPGLVAEGARGSQELLEAERLSAGVDAELVSVTAISAGGGLHREAEEQSADLLVVGSCTRGVIGRAFLGDDTSESLNGASCAVAIAPVGYAAHAASIAKIGVAYNGSPESEAALGRARELAAATGAAIQVLEVVSLPMVAYTGIVPPAIGESIDVMLADARSRMADLPDVDGEAIYGLAGEELDAFSGKVDLLIAGSRGQGPIKRLVLGSTSGQLRRHARCPLLILTRSAAAEIRPEDSGQVITAVV